MAKFLFVYRAPPMDGPPPSPEQMQAVLAAWGDWIGKFAQAGSIVDAGDGLKETGRVLNSKGVVTDGPFVEAKEVLGGYSIIQAPDYDAALKVAKACPAAQYGSIEIRELAGYN
ncbi:MAG TPA: YciI family protein [Gemmatales bacterium]|nr:YciI family protein [Gemmatales bacterium]HMP58780.1 YciI family protein [Gemmatales bacterium]